MNVSIVSIQSTVLVVESSLSTLMLLTKWLEMQEYRVIAAKTGQEALHTVYQQHPNIILISVYLPDQSGYSVCQQLQQQAQTACIPVIFLGEMDDDLDHEALLRAGEYTYITQPFQPQDILTQVNHHLKVWTLQQQFNQQVKLNKQLQQEIEERDRQIAVLTSTQSQLPQHSASSSDSVRLEQEQQDAHIALNNYIDYVLLLQQITDSIRVHFHPQDIFETAVAHVGRAFGVNRCVLLTYDPEQLYYLPVVAVFQDVGYSTLNHWIVCSRDNDYLKAVLAQDRAVVCSNDQVNVAFYRYGMDRDAMDGVDSSDVNKINTRINNSQKNYLNNNYDEIEWGNNDIVSMMSVRVSYQNQPNGVIMLQQCDRPHQWTEQDKFQLEAIASHIGMALAQARLLENEKHQRNILDVQNLQLQKEICQRQRTENALKQAKEIAETANRAKSEFLANMSHELRTPLNAILGFTQVLEQMDDLSPEQQDYLGIINRCGNHLLALISDVLEMSKIEAGQIDLHETNFDLGQLLHTIWDIVQLKAEEKDVTLSFICSTEHPRYVIADESKLRQILLNLLDNAVKFTTHGHVRLHVSIEPILETEITEGIGETIKNSADGVESFFSRSNPEEFGLRFEIEDTGPGIAENELDLLFQSFAQTETGKKHGGGTGLGLAITQKFVVLMGGQLMVESNVGVGTTFRFTIPVKDSDRPNSTTLKSDHPILKLTPGQQDYRILIVEDNRVNQKLLVYLLQSVGFRTQLVDNGKDAIQSLASWNPHLILMDIAMPKMDGLSATRLIRTLSIGQTIPIIALTAYAFEDMQQQALQAGFNDFLSKPIQRDYLLRKIADYLDVTYLCHNDRKLSKDRQLDGQQFCLDHQRCQNVGLSPWFWTRLLAPFSA